MVPNKLRQIIIMRIKATERKSNIAKALRIARSTVYKAVEAYNMQGPTDYITKPGRPVTKDKEDLIKAVRAEVNKNPNQSIRNLARTFNVSAMTMKMLVNNDLGLKSLAVVQVQQLTPLQRQRRLEMCTAMINELKGKSAGKILVFSDEKDFHLSKHPNRRNNRTLAACTKAVCTW